MRDVAERAQVSLKTVSRVINGEPGVASATAARVTQSIAELGFRRNDLARSLRQGSTSATLGLVIEDVANPFYSAVAQAVENAARERGYLLITGSCEEDPQRERELIQALMGRRVDALLLVPAGSERDHGWLEREVLETTPVVFLDRPARGIEADTVLLDNAGGARSAVEHLLASGHRRIAYVGDVPELFTASERLAGYHAALAAAGVEPDPRLIIQAAPDGAPSLVQSLLEFPRGRRRRRSSPATTATRSARCAPCAGASTRSRWSGSTISSSPSCSRCRRPSSSHDSFRMGTEAAALAFARLDGSTAPSQRLVLGTELIARGSGEVPPRP